ncbi:MAG: sporulation protein YunB, partial [Halanaerobiales bacterium]
MRFKFWRVVITFIILLLIIFYCVHRSITPAFFNLAEVKVKNIANQAINQAVAKEVENIDYQDIIKYVYNEQGEVVLMQPDIKSINTFTTSMSLAIQQELEKVSREVVKIPLTRILGVDILAGYGPDLDMQIVPAGFTVPPEVNDSFSAAGINQTRHKIYLMVAVDFKMIVPFSSKNVEVIAEVPVT